MHGETLKFITQTFKNLADFEYLRETVRNVCEKVTSRLNSENSCSCLTLHDFFAFLATAQKHEY